MEPQHLISCLQNSLSHVAEQRQQAESQLRSFENAHGCGAVLLKIVTSNEVPDYLRQAASISLKRVVVQRWEELEDKSVENPLVPMTSDEKALIRANIVEALIASPPVVRTQVGLCLRAIGNADFPQNWPELVPKVMGYLNSKEIPLVHGGILTLRIITRKFQFMPPTKKKQRVILDQLVTATFPTLIQLFQGLITSNTLEAAEMMLLLVKLLWSVIHFGVPTLLQDNNNLLPWMNLMLQLLESPVPTEGEPKDPDERKNWPWWKCKKWTAQNFTRMFQRFGDPKTCAVEEKTFTVMFRDTYAPKLLESFLAALAAKRNGQYLPDRVVNEALNYINTAIYRNKTYLLFQPLADMFFQQIVFPILCFSDADYRLMRDDPHEYLRKEFDIHEEFYSPRTAAVNITIDLSSNRGKHHLKPMMTFIVDLLQRYETTPPEQRNMREKDGVLMVLGSLAPKLTVTQGYREHIEAMLLTHVVPEFKNPHAFIRARTCWTFAQYYDIAWTNPEHFVLGLRSALQCLTDPELPVRVMAALSLRYLIQNKASTEEIRKVLPALLEQLFKIMNEIDFEELVNALELLVDKYHQEMGPYSVSLCANLVQSFLRMADNEEDEDSSIAASECLGAIQTLLHSISKTPELYPQVEQVLFPLLAKLTEPDEVEFLDEALKILSFITYYSPTISQNIWSLFPKLYNAIDSCGIDFISDLLIPLDNFISRGNDVFLSGPYPDMIFTMYKKCLVDEQVGEGHRTDGAKLAEVVLLNCKGRVDKYVEPFMELAVLRMQDAKRIELKVTLIGTVANAIYYNPAMALEILEKRGWTKGVFTLWFQLIPQLLRTHEKKLSILALSSLLSLPLGSLPALVQMGMKQIIETIVNLQRSLDQQREDIKKNAALKKTEGSDEDDIDGELPDDDDDEIGDEKFEGMAKKAAEFYSDLKDNGEENDEDDEDVSDEFDPDFDGDDDYNSDEEDDDEFASPVDVVDELVFFIDHMKALSTNDSASYHKLFGQLDENTKGSLQDLVNEADQRRENAKLLQHA